MPNEPPKNDRLCALPYRLLATDIDGTLLDSGNRLRPAVREALGRIHRAGIAVVLCTGRRYRTTLEVVRELDGMADVVICCGGAAVKRAGSGRTLRSWPLERALARRICLRMRSWGLVPVVLPDLPLEQREALVSVSDRDRMCSSRYFAMNEATIGFYEGEFPDGHDPILECYTCDLADKVGPAYPEALRQFGGRTRILNLAQIRYGSDHLALEFLNPEAGKSNALAWLLGRWQIDPDQVIAVGDDVNDVDMIAMAGAGVAMGNAPKAVREAAALHTHDHDHDGLAHALMELLPDVFEQENA